MTFIPSSHTLLAAKRIGSRLAFAFAFLAAILQLLDWFLTDKQKRVFTDKLIDAWIWLDGQRSGSFLPVAWSLKVQVPLTIICYFLFLRRMQGGTDADFNPKRLLSSLLIQCMLVACIAFHWLVVVRRIRRFHTAKAYFDFTVRAMTVAMIPTLLGGYLILKADAGNTWWPALIFIPATEALVLSSLISLSTFWVALSWCLAQVFRTVAKIFDRAISQQRGFFAALAILFLTIATLFKLFS